MFCFYYWIGVSIIDRVSRVFTFGSCEISFPQTFNPIHRSFWDRFFNKIYDWICVIFLTYFFANKKMIGISSSLSLLRRLIDNLSRWYRVKIRKFRNEIFVSNIFPFQSFKSVFVNLHITIQQRVTRIFQVSQMWKFYRVQKYSNIY